MARRKTLPESVRAKLQLAERLTALRSELFGERGGPEMARRLGIPVRTWYNYEGGVTVPAEVVLKIIELTSVEAGWLLHGEGPKFRHSRTDRRDLATSPTTTIGALLRTALELLERDEGATLPRGEDAPEENHIDNPGEANEPYAAPRHAPSAGCADEGRVAPAEKGQSAQGESRREWQAAQRDNRCIKVTGDAMAPVVADGASVAFARDEEDARQLDGKMVVTWLENQAVVRWFQHCGRFALLRAENPATVPQQLLVDLEDGRQRPQFRRVLWINTPH
jgi:phage repressor protein C with HTH and peptisase S24 domain